MFDAKQTIERITRGHFRLQIVQHGDGGANREIQVVDTVENFMVKGVTEQAIIAHILLDARTATKHFEPIKAKKELAAEVENRSGGEQSGLQRVIDVNKDRLAPPKVTKRKPWPKLRAKMKDGDYEKYMEEAERREREALAESEESVVQEVVERAAGSEVDPAELASIWEFESDDARGMFLGIATAFGSEAVEQHLDAQRPDIPLTEEFVESMGSALSDDHVEGEAAEVEVIEEKPAKKAKKPKVFKPEK